MSKFSSSTIWIRRKNYTAAFQLILTLDSECSYKFIGLQCVLFFLFVFLILFIYVYVVLCSGSKVRVLCYRGF